MQYACAKCGVLECRKEKKEHLPLNCPMRQEEMVAEAMAEYGKEENQNFFITSTQIESAGYGLWTRMQETMEFCKRMGYQKVGIAFCVGLQQEAKILTKYLERNGLEVVSVICKTGGKDKTEVGVPEESKLQPGSFETMCNPILQAKVLNDAQTKFNIILGLCVGHDSLFIRYSQAPVTTLVAKDRVLVHNPCAAIYAYDGYYKSKLQGE